MLPKLGFFSGNCGKATELKRMIGTDIVDVTWCQNECDEIQSLDIEKVAAEKLHAMLKTRDAKNSTGFMLVEDASLEFHALCHLPGTFVKFFEEGLGPYGLAKMLEMHEHKGATAVVAFALHDFSDHHQDEVFVSKVKGTIVEPRGSNGFGWDCIFVPDGATQTFAEMTEEEKTKHSPRALCLQKVRERLKKIISKQNKRKIDDTE
jgi:inosine triphosphate pyrophosphatase